MARFKIITGGQSRLYDILDDAFTAGSAASNAIRIQEHDVAEVHARVWRNEDGVWVGAIDDVPLRVNGQLATRQRLRHGDRIELGAGCALEFVDPGSGSGARSGAAAMPGTPNPVAAKVPAAPAGGASPIPLARLSVPSAAREARELRSRRTRSDEGAGRARARGGRERSGEERRGGRARRSEPGWHLVSGLALLGIVLLVIAIRVLTAPIPGESAADLLALAETQLERGSPQLALQTTKTATARAAGDGDMLRRIAAFEDRARQAAQAAADAVRIEVARQALDNLHVFEKTHLAATPAARPASRELVRAADAWRERYAAMCDRYPDSARMVQEVTELRERYAGAAQLAAPDDAEDVLFAARHATRLRRPRYREAVAKLDAFLASGGTADGAERVRAFRAELVRSGREWLDKKVAMFERECRRGRIDAVLGEVDTLLEEAVLEEWRPDLEARVKVWKQAAGR